MASADRSPERPGGFFQSLPDEILLQIIDLVTFTGPPGIGIAMTGPDDERVFCGRVITWTPGRSKRDIKSLSLVCRHFWRLTVYSQFEELKLSVDHNKNQTQNGRARSTAPTKVLSYRHRSRSQEREVKAAMRLHTVLSDNPDLRGMCRSFSIKVNCPITPQEYMMLKEMIAWMQNLRTLTIDINSGPVPIARAFLTGQIRKASSSLPGLETLVLYCGTRTTQIIDLCDVVQHLRIPTLKELVLWRLGPLVGDDRIHQFRKMIANPESRPSFECVWFRSVDEHPKFRREFLTWPEKTADVGLDVPRQFYPHNSTVQRLTNGSCCEYLT